MRLNTSQTIFQIVLPEALPYILAGVRLALSTGLVIVVVAEMFGVTNQGVGYKIVEAQLMYEIAEMYSLIFLIGLFGYTVNKFYQFLESKTVHWQ